MRHEHRADGNAELFARFLQYAVEIYIFLIAFVHKKSLRDADLVCVFDGVLRPHVYARLGVYNNQGAVRNPDRLLCLAREIKEAGRVDNINLGILPVKRENRTLNRKLPPFFFIVVIAHGVSVVYFALPVRVLGEKKNRLRQRRFPAVPVT
jgi:hypothetical protein